MKIRDGDTLQSDLIGEYIGGMENKLSQIESSSSQILIEFYSENLSSLDHGLCGGGFLGHATQICKFWNLIIGFKFSIEYRYSIHLNLASTIVASKSSSSGIIAAAAAVGNVTLSAIKNSISSHKLNIIDFKLTLAHVAAIIFVSFISLISLMLGEFFLSAANSKCWLAWSDNITN